MAIIDKSGQRFGRLVARQRVGIGQDARWACDCDCGGSTLVRTSNLKGEGGIRSCGCVLPKMKKNASAKTHGRCTQPGHDIWRGMLRRCSDKTDKNYGGRGIIVCDRWLVFENFLQDMGRRPSAKHTIDRIDVDGNYEPSNCRWATPEQQASNRRELRGTRMLTFGGQTLSVTAWSRRIGVSRQALFQRLQRDSDALRSYCEERNLALR